MSLFWPSYNIAKKCVARETVSNYLRFMNEIQKAHEAEKAIANVETVEQGTELRDYLQSIVDLAKRRDVDYQQQFEWEDRVRRTERKIGSLLAELPKHPGGRGKKNLNRPGGSLSETQSRRFQWESKLTDEQYGLLVDRFQKNKEDLSAEAVVREARKLYLVREVTPPDLPEGQFGLIYADPPWRYDYSKSNSREIENQYPTMTLAEICDLDIDNMTTEDCTLFLWGTSPKLTEAMEVIRSWGFTYRTCAVWDKINIGMGYYFRQQHELLLVGTKGAPQAPSPENRPGSVIREKRGEHSRKPTIFHETLEIMYPNTPKIELFSRNERPGWEMWGFDAKRI